VLINDFGAIDIDGDLVDAFDGQTLRLANGCICCSLAGGLAEALQSIRDVVPQPDRVVIEASGVADPALTAGYAALPGFGLDAVIVLVDVATVRRNAADRYVGRHVVRQLEGADLLVLNKADLVTGEELERTRAWIESTLPGIALVMSTGADVPTSVVFGPSLRPPRQPADAGIYCRFEQWAWQADQPLEYAAIRDALFALPDGIVRAKGVFEVHAVEHRTIFQSVGTRSSLEPGRAWGSEPRRSRLVAIARPGAGGDPELRRALAALDKLLTPVFTKDLS
jgi:G3E family GTPase